MQEHGGISVLTGGWWTDTVKGTTVSYEMKIQGYWNSPCFLRLNERKPASGAPECGVSLMVNDCHEYLWCGTGHRTCYYLLITFFSVQATAGFSVSFCPLGPDASDAVVMQPITLAHWNGTITERDLLATIKKINYQLAIQAMHVSRPMTIADAAASNSALRHFGCKANLEAV